MDLPRFDGPSLQCSSGPKLHRPASRRALSLPCKNYQVNTTCSTTGGKTRNVLTYLPFYTGRPPARGVVESIIKRSKSQQCITRPCLGPWKKRNASRSRGSSALLLAVPANGSRRTSSPAPEPATVRGGEDPGERQGSVRPAKGDGARPGVP